MNLDSPLVWAEIDLSAIAHNIRELRRITHPKAKLMGVVKADGYGHGAVEVVQCALQNGAELLGVARIEEGIQIRDSGIGAPILIFGHTPPELAPTLLASDLTPTVCSLAAAEALSEKAASLGKTIRVHLKVDTGMGRLGLMAPALRPQQAGRRAGVDPVQEALSIASLARLEVEGIFTHFATADSADKSYADQQLDVFMDFLNRLRKSGLEPRVTHAANSAALIDMPQSHLDIVRPGIASYGLYPSAEVNKKKVRLKPAMAFKTRIIQLKKVSAGFKISYGATYQTQKPTTIATVAVGYADGLNRLLSSSGQVLVGGKRASIVGRICMDLTMLDVGRIDHARIGDEVVILGQQGNESITADEMASSLNTINYEIVTSITARVPRVYLKPDL